MSVIAGQFIPNVATSEIEIAVHVRSKRTFGPQFKLGAELAVLHQHTDQPAATLVVAIGIDGLDRARDLPDARGKIIVLASPSGRSSRWAAIHGPLQS